MEKYITKEPDCRRIRFCGSPFIYLFIVIPAVPDANVTST